MAESVTVVVEFPGGARREYSFDTVGPVIPSIGERVTFAERDSVTGEKWNDGISPEMVFTVVGRVFRYDDVYGHASAVVTLRVRPIAEIAHAAHADLIGRHLQGLRSRFEGVRKHHRAMLDWYAEKCPECRRIVEGLEESNAR